MEHIKSAISRVKQEFNIESIGINTNIIDEVGIDSLEMIQFILQLEDEYEIEIDFDELDIELFTNAKKLDEFCISQKQAKKERGV